MDPEEAVQAIERVKSLRFSATGNPLTVRWIDVLRAIEGRV
jgi:hypothetical protein